MYKIIFGLLLLILFVVGCDIPEEKEETIGMADPIVIVVVEESNEKNNDKLLGEDAKNYMVENLKYSSAHLKLFNKIYDIYIDKEHKFKGNYARLVISPEIMCNKNRCIAGQVIVYANSRIEIVIYKNIIDDSNYLLFVFLHELGHLIKIYYLDVTEEIEWNEEIFKVSQQKLREDSIDEFFRDYSKISWGEDFSDSYAIYILQNNGIRIYFNGDKDITENRKEFMRRIADKIKPYEEEVIVIFI